MDLCSYCSRPRSDHHFAVTFAIQEHNDRVLSEDITETASELQETGARIANIRDADILARWPVSAESNFPMALDEADHRLFIGVWKPPQLPVFDTSAGKQVAAGEIAGKTDDLFYDSGHRRVYVLTSEGYLEVFEQKDSDHYEPIARYPTPPRSQTGLFVPGWGKLFVAVPAENDRSAEIRVYQAH